MIIQNREQVALGSKIISDLVCLQIIIIKCLLLLESNRSFSSVRVTALNNLQFVSSDPPPSSFEASYSPRIISPPGVLTLLYHSLVYTVKKKGTKHCCSTCSYSVLPKLGAITYNPFDLLSFGQTVLLSSVPNLY